MHRTTSIKRARVLIPIGIVVVATLLVGLVVWMQRDSSPETEPAPSPSTPTQSAEPDESTGLYEPSELHELDFSHAERRDEQDLLTAGPVDAPIGLIVFSDYQCPFCAQWNEETLPAMMELADAGLLRIEWRDTNIFGEASWRASHAAYAAALQDSYWEYHDLLFIDGEKRPESELSEEALIALAAELSLDTERFARDMRSASTADAVQENVDLAMELGAASTPSFIFGGIPISGAQPPDVFMNIFDALLLERGQE